MLIILEKGSDFIKKLTSKELTTIHAGSILDDIFKGIEFFFDGAALIKSLCSNSGEIKTKNGIDIKFDNSKKNGSGSGSKPNIIFPNIYIS